MKLAFIAWLVVLIGTAWLPYPSSAAQQSSMPLLTFDGPDLPRNKAGATYPSQYEPDGTARVSLDPTDAVSGKSIRFEVTKGCFYAQFNAHNPDGTRGFAPEYAARRMAIQHLRHPHAVLHCRRVLYAAVVSAGLPPRPVRLLPGIARGERRAGVYDCGHCCACR